MKKGKVVAGIANAPTEEVGDHDETYTHLWPVMRTPPPKPIPTSNSFEDLNDSDDDDESDGDVR